MTEMKNADGSRIWGLSQIQVTRKSHGRITFDGTTEDFDYKNGKLVRVGDMYYRVTDKKLHPDKHNIATYTAVHEHAPAEMMAASENARELSSFRLHDPENIKFEGMTADTDFVVGKLVRAGDSIFRITEKEFAGPSGSLSTMTAVKAVGPVTTPNTPKLETFAFGKALKHLKAGRQVARKDWRDRIFLALIQPEAMAIATGAYSKVDGDAWVMTCREEANERYVLQPFIGAKTGNDTFVPWVPTQAEMLATDWVVLPA